MALSAPPPPTEPSLPSPRRTLLAALAPTRWLFLGISVVLGMRLAAWGVRRAWLPEMPALREVAKALAWDTFLVLAVFALARSLGAVRLRAVRVLGWLALLLLVLAAMLVRWFDFAHCFMVRAHWTADAFAYLDQGFGGSIRDPRLVFALAAWLATAGVLFAALRRDSHALAPVWQQEGQARWLVLALVIALLPALWAVRDGVKYPAYPQQIRLIPEVNFALQYRMFTREPPKTVVIPRLDKDRWQRFQRLGLVPPTTALDSAWPLLHEHLDQTPFPYPRRPNAPLQPNVVVTFMESTNAMFVHGLSGHYRGLMPEVSALVPQLTSADAFYNTSSPTIAALVTALCSLHPSAHPSDLRPGTSVDGRAAYTCLADILRDRGYRTIFVQTASKTVTSKEYFLRTHGFDEMIGREDLEARFKDRPQGPWGPHDSELVTVVKEQIARLEKLRAQDGRPFLLVMLTLDSHDPGMAGPECGLSPNIDELPQTERARQLLAGYHCSDRALGDLGRFVLAAPRKDRTVWLLTADHAAFSDLVPEEIYVDPTARHQSDKIPFLLHDPLHELPQHLATLGDTRDVSPTLLHILGVGDPPNSMGGMSLFGGRRTHPFLIGRVGERLAFARSADTAIELPIGLVREHCEKGETLMHVLDVDFTACDLAAWIDWRDALWGAKRIFPPSLYHGDVGVDKEELTRRQELNREEKQLQQAGLPVPGRLLAPP